MSYHIEKYGIFEEYIEELHNWELINHVKHPSGFAGSAFKNERGEIVFAFKGSNLQREINLPMPILL